MPRKPRMKSSNGIYHVMLRGANRQEIFHDDFDRMRFLDIFKKYTERSGMVGYAWCLMNNHVHLLVKEGDEGLSATMKRIGVSYASYYNAKYKTTGHLFQDRFRSENVESRRYFLRVIRYIHQNPVKAGMVEKADEWRWSSCAWYYGQPDYPGAGLLDNKKVFQLLSENPQEASRMFKEFNEQVNDDECMDEEKTRRRMTDDEAREKIRSVLDHVDIAQFKSLPKPDRNLALAKIRTINGLSHRQTSRILGISASLIKKAWLL